MTRILPLFSDTPAERQRPSRQPNKASRSNDELLRDALNLGFVHSGWCQAALPHRKQADDRLPWRVSTPSITLLVEPGHDANGTPIGVPYGPAARLIMIHLQTEALRTGSRNIELGHSLNEFLRRLGMTLGGRTRNVVREQAHRISRCRFSFHSNITVTGRNSFVQQNIVDAAILGDWQSTEPGGQRSLFVERARLSEIFFEQLTRHAVPLDESALHALKAHSMALDVYCWLAYRLHALKQPAPISWAALHGQFGNSIEKRKNFMATFRDALRAIHLVYPDARYHLTPSGIILHHSPPPVSHPQATVA